MRLFSFNKRKLEPHRRFGGSHFRNKVKKAANYKRAFNPNPTPWATALARLFRGHLALWRNLGIVVFLVIFYYLTLSSHFLVTNIEVIGSLAVSEQQVMDVIAKSGEGRLFLVKKNNYFLLTSGRVNNLITTAIPEIKSVKTNRDWPNRIHIEVTERHPGFVIESNGNYFLVDDEGTIVKQIDSVGGEAVAHDQLTENFARNEILNTKLVPFVISMIKQWPGKISMPVATIKFPGKESSDAEFVTTAGWSVLFDTSRSATSQLNGLSLLLAHQILPKDQVNLAYIDLRSNKWAYYCFKSTPCSQVPQPEPPSNP